ncbi:porin family protein [Acidobacteria bacterium AB60]|nr:porin family protein [Acidobacteria bacterium AB60]
MVSLRSLKLLVFAVLIAATLPLFSQVVPAASERGRMPIAFGVGRSDFSIDWGPGRRMSGTTAWLDWTGIPYTPKVLRGLGLDIEGRDINSGLPAGVPRMRQDTALGGFSYTSRRFGRVQPYGKYLVGFGSIDFGPLPIAPRTYTHDTRTVYAPGGGLQVQAFRGLSVRADYEYQFWPRLFGPHSLNPNGFSFGAMYTLGGQPKSW